MTALRHGVGFPTPVGRDFTASHYFLRANFGGFVVSLPLYTGLITSVLELARHLQK
jgi:hypothetical protein